MSYYQPNQYYQLQQGPMNGYVSPSHLTNMTNMNLPTPSASYATMPPLKQTPANRGVKLQDVGSLEPGKQHQLSQDPIPTPQSILDGTYAAAMENKNQRDVVTIVPRRPEYCGIPSLPTIIFSVNGKAGPYLKDIMKSRVAIDNPFDMVFREMAWKQTSLTIDWPGVTTNADYIPCVDKSHHFTRTEVAQIVAARVAQIVMTGHSGQALKWGPQVIDATTKPWCLRKIDYRDVRLIGINYYRKTWVPVLAMDA